jgi:farnesyl diphosphate synthase
MGLGLSVVEQDKLKGWLAGVAAQVEAELDSVLPRGGEGIVESPLYEAMRYSVLGGGKRLRAALVQAAYMAAGGAQRTPPLVAAAAMEMIHAYSLVQDDLPCLDNDTLRRGKPTTHVKYGEMMALMASDGLQTGAYELLCSERLHANPSVRMDIVRLFAQASGAKGMVAGQVVDMAYEEAKPGVVKLADLQRMHLLKTGLNIRASVLTGVILAGGEAGVRAALETYATHVGRAYQVWDDVLDATATAEQLGKTPGKDAKAGKATYVTLLGLEKAKALAGEEVQTALAALAPLGEKALLLELLARYVVTREG